MKNRLALAAFTVLGLSGCGGVPVVVSAASLYIDSVLFLRTNKTAGDHVISAVADRDCAFLNLLSTGRLCDDAPAPELLAELTREVKNVPLTEEPPPAVQVAAVPARTLNDAAASAGAAPAPPRLPAARREMAAAPTRAATVVAATVVAAPPPAVAAAPRPAPSGAELLVVVGSYSHRQQAEHRVRSLGRRDVDIVEASVLGRPYYRVAIRSGNRQQALRALTAARSAGIRDAWLLPSTGNMVADTAVAALLNLL